MSSVCVGGAIASVAGGMKEGLFCSGLAGGTKDGLFCSGLDGVDVPILGVADWTHDELLCRSFTGAIGVASIGCVDGAVWVGRGTLIVVGGNEKGLLCTTAGGETPTTVPGAGDVDNIVGTEVKDKILGGSLERLAPGSVSTEG